MPVYRLPPQHLTAPILQRTSVTLTFLLHFYVHSHPASLQSTLRIPPSISVPLLQISSLLGLPPILTYATTVLYNVIPLHPGLPFHPHSNPPTRVHQTFTGTKSEEHFYLVSSLIEIHGVRALSIMRAALDEAFVGDALALKRIGAGLRQLASAIGELTQVFKEMRKGCVPEEFYWLIRPWFKGSDGDGPSSLGWLFDLGEEAKEERRVVSGPSAGQSSLIHSLDIFLGIDHSPHSTNFVAKPSAAGATLSPAAALALKKPSSEGDSTFMQRMLTVRLSFNNASFEEGLAADSCACPFAFLPLSQYMPGPHRAFLLHLQASRPTVRDLVLSNIDFGGGELARSYDEAVTAMGKLRDGHSASFSSSSPFPLINIPPYLMY
jgi:indoleamine 2,3-dioxygenase